jgi:N-acetylglutamate synthase-like GNAT family acetyltransferase
VKIITLSQEVAPAVQARIHRFLASLSDLYPGFNHWIENRVFGSTDSVILLAQEGEHIAGVAIGRKGDNPKLRCVRTHRELQGSGLGIKLLDGMIDHLQCEKPHVTVAEEMMHEYSRAFVKRYGFSLSDVTKGEYRPRKLEYHWN